MDAPVFCSRVYYKAAGTYTFRLEGMLASYNDPGGTVWAADPQVFAVYLPMSYSTVEATVADPGDHPDARLLSPDELDENEAGQARYEVDLRYYELKAKAAREAAMEAERELEEARERDRAER